MRRVYGLLTLFLVVLPAGPSSWLVSAQQAASPRPPQTAQPPGPALPAPPRDQGPATQVVGTGVIRGRIVDAEGDRPLRRARITVSSPSLPRPRTTSTNIEGRYEVKDLPQGRFTVAVSRSGYLPLTYGQRRPFEQGKPIELAPGQVLEPVDFALPKMGLITGRITNDLGEPVQGARVLAMRWAFVNGERRFVPTGPGLISTDDTGTYRLAGLVPGNYIVMSQAAEQWTVEAGTRREQMGFAPTYFPGTDAPESARRIVVALGKVSVGNDFALIPGRAATISGTAFDSKGQIFRTVELTDEVRGVGFGGAFRAAGSATVAADGTFSIPNVSPGQYKLGARHAPNEPGTTPEVAIVPVIVSGVDLLNVSLTGSSGGTISGVVRTDAGALPRGIVIRTPLRLLGQPDPMMLGTFRDAALARVNEDGTFELKNVFGPTRVDAVLPDGWVVKSISRNGQDITDQSLSPASGDEWPNVQIVITNQPTLVTGQLRDANGRPAIDGTLVVFAADPARWSDQSRYVQAARPDQQGKAQIKGLPPGDYLAAAVDYVEDGSWYETEFLQSLRDSAQKLTLVESGTHTATLTVVTR